MDKKRQGYGPRVMFTLFLVSMLAPLSLSVRAGETQASAAFTEEDTIGLLTSAVDSTTPMGAAVTEGSETLKEEIPGNGDEIPGIEASTQERQEPEVFQEEGKPSELPFQEEGEVSEPTDSQEEGNFPEAEAVREAGNFPGAEAVREAGDFPEAGNQEETKDSAGFTRVIFVGDSRFVQMRNVAGENSHVWIAKVSQGYVWLTRKALSQIDEAVESGTKVLLNLGVNDTWDADAYIKLVNEKAAEWMEQGAQVYYASVNPVKDGRYVTVKDVERFNEKMQSGLDPEIGWIDSYSWLEETGYTLTDGLHFDNETSERLYRYYLEALGMESKDYG